MSAMASPSLYQICQPHPRARQAASRPHATSTRPTDGSDDHSHIIRNGLPHRLTSSGFDARDAGSPMARKIVWMTFNPVMGVYVLIFAVIWTVYIGLRSPAAARSRERKAAAADAGLSEPASLHPVIDPSKCVGCGACVRACPEGDILGMINGKAELIEPSHCIGHGACKDVCPRDAIALVFGTEKRGVDIPDVGPDFQTN